MNEQYYMRYVRNFMAMTSCCLPDSQSRIAAEQPFGPCVTHASYGLQKSFPTNLDFAESKDRNADREIGKLIFQPPVKKKQHNQTIAVNLIYFSILQKNRDFCWSLE